jgi:hypothetical protein
MQTDANVPDPSLVDEMIQRTIDPQLLKKMQAIIQPLKDKGEAEQARAALLQTFGINKDTALKYANDYCDRLFVGVDSWSEDDRKEWVAVCKMITELTSAVVI